MFILRKIFTAILVAWAILWFGAAQESSAAKTWELFEDINVDKEWKIKFNKGIDQTTVPNNVYILQGTNKVATTATVDANTILIKPTESLKPGTSYQLVVNNQVKDVTGRSIKQAVSVPFKTKENEPKEPVKAVQTFQSEYDMTWNLLSLDYENFRLVGTDAKGNIVGGYETKKSTTHFGITIGTKSEAVTNKYGTPVKAILKNNVNYIQNYKDNAGNTTSGTYLMDNKYVTFFYDIHSGNTVRSIMWVNEDTEATKLGYFRTNTTSEYRKGLEDLMVYLISESRVAAGLHALIYTPTHNSVARNHSLDMVKNNYFSHTNLKNMNPRDRMIAGNMKFSWYGENIAYGQYSTIHAHEALMNSLGHRENILRSQFTHMISGVAFNSTNTPYYTINFYRE